MNSPNRGSAAAVVEVHRRQVAVEAAAVRAYQRSAWEVAAEEASPHLRAVVEGVEEAHQPRVAAAAVVRRTEAKEAEPVHSSVEAAVEVCLAEEVQE